ncbi:unnamed protein product [Phyllotreta striolata]|uniref:Ig-like domain-containing protein n=1 Tax=Phyllotreta striolata TaxID=444603 RepID=A0A9N9TTT8_PHYSR|nr:unnamed protein product [Phyllotreta striolata]
MEANGPVENGTRLEEVPPVPSTSSAMLKTTTISTIAVQSGHTRIVIALLHCGDWISLKVLEITPDLTLLGNTLPEALALQEAHDEVLRQLQVSTFRAGATRHKKPFETFQNKQSPVEELLRQADQLIATQRPRAEVYAAMAESLGRAWKDINGTLELRKRIIDLNVLYHRAAGDFFDKAAALEVSCKETEVPVNVDAVKDFLTMVHEQRRALLEALMGALQAGNSLLARLKELGAEGTLDSRPERLRTSVNKAVSQVQGWLDELHLRRQVLEGTFCRRKTQLEQCLALAILAADLRELEGAVQNRRELLTNSNQYGDSSSSAELLLHEHKKLLPEAQQLQERALKITKATEQLVSSGCYAGEEATQQAYAILSATSDYLADLQSREALLERVIAFFRSAQMVLTKLNQLEIQLTATVLPKTSPQLAQLHAQCAKAIEEATSQPLAEGYAILDAAGRGTGAEGVKAAVEELENKKILLDGLCTAHKEENVMINRALNNFLEKHNEIYNWLVTIAEAFLQAHRDMGNDLIMAKDFYDLHNQLLNDLQTKGTEINALLLTLPPILEYLEDGQRKDVDVKVEQLHERWMKLKGVLENRMELARIYVKFHTEAETVHKGMDELDGILARNRNSVDDDVMRHLEEKFETIKPLYQSAKNTGITFIEQIKSITEHQVDANRARLCVEAVLERLSGRQLVVARTWQTFHAEVAEHRELLVRLEVTMEESTKTIGLATKLDTQLYPIITSDSTAPKDLADYIENKLSSTLPEIRKAQSDVNQKLKETEKLLQQAAEENPSAVAIRNKLQEFNQKLQDTVSDYQVLCQVLIGYFRNLEEIDKKAELYNAELQKTLHSKDVSSIDRILQEHESQKQTITERLRFAQAECDQIADRITKQEPPDAAQRDVAKLQHVLQLQRAEFERQWKQKQDSLLSQRQISAFDGDLKTINENIEDINKQLKSAKNQYGESLSSAKAALQAFGEIEELVKTMEERIQSFIKSSEKLIAENHQDATHVQSEISALQDRWNNLKNQMKTTRSLIDTSVHYFQLVEEADEWFREGSKLLVTIARKSTSVKQPEEAEQLLEEVSDFLTPGEEKQNEKIEKITELAAQLYGPDDTKYAPVLRGNQEMLESFAAITKELNTLAGNLKASEEERARLEKEREDAKRAEEARKLEEEKSREEARLAEEARKAEEARSAEERRKAEEAKLAEEARLAREKIQAEEQRLLVEKQKLEEAKRAEEARMAEERKKAEEAKLEEEAKLAEERKKLEDEKHKLEEAKLANETRKAEDQQKIKEAEAKLKEEQATLAKELKKHSIEISEVTDLEIQTTSSTRGVPSPIPIVEDASEAPVFVSPLSDAVIQEGNKFTFMCQVTGHPAPTITWYKAGISIQNNPDYRTTFEAGLCSLTIEETFAEDSARYTCRASNPAGEDETSAVLSVKESEPEEVLQAPSFSKPLQPGQAKEGTGFQFECLVDGNPLPTVQWFKNGECIDNSPDYSITYNNGNAILKFEAVRLEDKAEYSCKAANQMGNAQCTANLAVTPAQPAEAPTIVSPLSNVMARAGQKIKLECEIAGLPAPTLTWSHNGKPVKETREIKLQQEGDKATLLVLEAFPKDAGAYAVTATNVAGEAATSCSVSVKGRLPTETSDSEIASDMEPVKPSIQLPLSNAAAAEGARVRLDCVIVGQPEPEVIWYHDDRPVKESQDFQLLFQGDRCSLVIQEVLPEDGGEYKVVALNSAGEASSRCILSVTPSESGKPAEDKPGVAPKFSKLLTDVLVSEGDRVILEGNVAGEPTPDVKWLLNNLPVTDTEHFVFTRDDDGNFKLEIANVKPEDKGVYTVKATNSAGEAKCFAQLIVKSFKPTDTVLHEEVKQPPEFKEGFGDRTIYEDTATKFECIVVGKPTPKIKWLFNEEPISGKDFLVSTSGNREVLSIPVAKRDHSGTVTCHAENEAGKAHCTASLLVQPSATIALQENQPEALQHVETSYKSSKEVVTQSQTSHTSKIISDNNNVEEHRVISQNAQTFKQIDGGAPEIAESRRIEEYHKLPEKSPSSQELQVHKPARIRPAKFVTPIIGKIVDQYVDVTLEGILDGQPAPQVKWTKNGQDIVEDKRTTITWQNNRTALEIKSVSVQDAGRYSCTAINEGGTAVSTADLVVRKTIFPPVFGRRLQAQVIKKGDRIIMEVEITGSPEPTVTWYKDGNLINDRTTYKIKSMGQGHTLIIDNAGINHSGRYMVRATNSGGEAQSIADVAVIEPAPDSMVEVVKSVVFEDVRKHETLLITNFPFINKKQATSAGKLSAVSEQALVPMKVTAPTDSRIISTELSQSMSCKSEVTSTTEQSSSEEKRVVKLEHKMPDIPMPKPIVPAGADLQHEIYQEKKVDDQEGIETSSISKQSSLQYFVKKIKEGDAPTPKEITLPESIKPDIYEKFEQKIPPPVPPKPEPSIQEYHSFKSSQSIVPPQEHFQSFSTTQITQDFQLQPEPPAEICYAPQPPPSFKRHEDVSQRIKRISESQKELSPHEVPRGAIKIFPSTQKTTFTESSSSSYSRSMESSTSKTLVRPSSVQGEPSEEGLVMEKQWAHKFTDSHQEKSWPPPQPEEIKYQPTWSVQSTLEKKWTPSVAKQDTFTQSKSEYIIEESNAKPSEIIKSWPPPPPPPGETRHALDVLPIRPISVQDITDEVYLEPGPPPEIAYAPPCPPRSPQPREWVAPPPRPLPEEWTAPPPPLPPKQVIPRAPPVPAKNPQHAETSSLTDTPLWPERRSAPGTGPPPAPAKFAKGRFADSDYESDFEGVKEVKKLSRHARDVKRSALDAPALAQRGIDGYMADTELCREAGGRFSKTGESAEVAIKPRVCRKIQTDQKELVNTPIVTNRTTQKLYEHQDKHVQFEKHQRTIVPSPIRPHKGECRESDYESDHDRRIPPVWGPQRAHKEPAYKPVRPVLTPTKQHDQYGRTPASPVDYRPKFEPIKPEVKPAQKTVVYKPKPIAGDLILRPGTPPEIVYAPGPKSTQYYRSTVSAPYTNAVQHETSNSVHFDESSEHCHRTMSVQQTHKVIKFGEKDTRRSTSVPPAATPTPSKFVPGEFRESDYESEVDGAKIKAKWTPHGPQDGSGYRRVKAPTPGRSSSVPSRKERVLSPMEFDTPPDYRRQQHQSVYGRFSESKNSQLVKREPQYGYAPDHRIKSTAGRIAADHMDSMTHAFKSKTHKFVADIMEDVNRKQPAVKNGDAQVYREESRAAQYGTKHVDPDTGLIYFKYDFGYEFGIILPGEGGKAAAGKRSAAAVEPPKRTRDIELPVYHEKSGQNRRPSPQFKPKEFAPTGRAANKWEPTSESEVSEGEGGRSSGGRLLAGSRWEPSSCSPASLSPSLPSTSPAFNNTFAVPGRQTPPSCPSTPGSTHKVFNPAQARAPLFITPLRDIAVVSGQSAKFECIVQSEPQPNVLWSKNGRIVNNSRDYQLHYRNGVCRLTIAQAYPEDAGTYTCTATNPIGAANTSATLEVPGERRSQYIK